MGGAAGFRGVNNIGPDTTSFQDNHASALHIISALTHGRYLRNLLKVHTKDEIKRKLNLDYVFLYEWNPYLYSHIATACDLAIIPIDMRTPFWVSKPSNKLIFFWRIAMPTLVDPTPAYVKLMDECGLDMVCKSSDEWLAKLELYSMDKERRQAAGLKAKMFVDEYYNEQILLGLWDSVFESVL